MSELILKHARAGLPSRNSRSIPSDLNSAAEQLAIASVDLTGQTKKGYAPQMIVPEIVRAEPSPWSALATQISTGQARGLRRGV